jgi:hypothetical protein
MLSMHSEFNDVEIADVHVFRSGTVYLLTGHGDEKLVVKAEPNNIFKKEETFKNTKLAMKAVDRHASKVKRLSAAEVKALEDWAEWIIGVCTRYSDNKVHDLKPPPSAADLLSKVRDSRNDLWYKMPLADLTDAEKMLVQRMSGDKSVMTMFADGLNAVGGIEQLGRIIAADFYNGNADRFNPTEGSSKTFGTKTLKFKVIKNVGNIFVVGKDTQQRMSVSGHDFIDPNSGFKDFEMSLGDITEGYNQQWLGDHLCSRSLRKKFVGHVIDDLELVLTPNRKSYSPFRKLTSKAGKRLDSGIVDGMRLIVGTVTARYSKPGAKWPANAKQRVDKFRSALG